MLRSFARRGGILIAALALPVLLLGNAATAATPSQAKLASATLNGDGSTFQLGFNQVCIGGFKQQQKAVTINYQGNGSGAGRTDFVNGVVDFAGTDAAYKTTDPQPPKPFFYFPTVVAPITVSYNLSGVKLNLSPETAAKIFSGAITTWDDAAIKTDNPKAKLPSTSITVVHRADGSGTTHNFTEFLNTVDPTDWTLGSGDTVDWPSSTQAGTGNPGVAQDVQQTSGAIGYVDLADATKARLSFASIQNKSGKFVAPTLAGASAAVAGSTFNADLSYDPINASGADAYPITSPTWIMVYEKQSNKAKGDAVKAFLQYVYSTGEGMAATNNYAALPAAAVSKATAQLSQLQIPAS